jgi:hypothetical protein
LYKYKFSENLEANKDKLWEINKKKGKMVIDSSLKETKSRVIIKNFLNKLLNLESLDKYINEEKKEISWSIIAEKIKIYSKDDLKNYWAKLMKDLNLDKKCMISQDMKMINYISRNGFESIDEINFSKIKNKM